jgi:branched-chain amino acid transport system permease protein
LLVGAVVGTVLALPALRISGIALALVTLAVAVVFPQVLRWRKLTWVTGGARGLDGTGFDFRAMRHVELFGWDPFGDLRAISGKTPFLFWVAVTVAGFVAIVCHGVAGNRPGRALVAIRDGERAAAVVGIDVARTKVAVFGLSGGLCALAGSVSALRTGTVVPDAADITVNGALVLLVVVVLGGAGTLWGPPIGAVIYVAITDTTRDWSDEQQVPWLLRPLLGWSRVAPGAGVFAAALIALMFVAPDGIVGLLGRCRRRLAARHDGRPTGTVRPCSPDLPRTAPADRA